mmetsp:Transcript_12358/g.45747  ORF Transcript_12358/g.45747 Transcript_12358/m.45747 type:complete len:213 (-) Transcript_12358:350-988(-)
MDGLDAVAAQGDLGGEERSAGDVALHEGALRDALLSVEGLEKLLCEVRPGDGHGQGGTSCAVLGLHDLVSAELDPLRERGDVFVAEVGAFHLGEQGQDRGARMAPDHRHVRAVHVRSLVLGHECLGAHDVQGRHPEEVLLVVHAGLLEHLLKDRHGGVHRVRDDQEVRLRAVLGARLCQRLHDARVGVEQVVPGHAWLARHAGRDDDHLAIL